MTTQVLSIVVLIGSGVTAGVLFAVALSVLPGLWSMPPEQYVYAHQRIGARWDPTMPIVVLLSATVGAVLSGLLWRSGAGWLFATGAFLLIGVSVVSHFCNVPMNRQVKALDPARIPEGWRDPRPVWRRWHLLRTVLALAALAVNATAVVVLD